MENLEQIPEHGIQPERFESHQSSYWKAPIISFIWVFTISVDISVYAGIAHTHIAHYD